MKRRDLLTSLVALGLLPALPAFAGEGDLKTSAMNAWLFSLPLIEMANARTRTASPVNRLAHRRTLNSWQDRAITAPNNDTLYSASWLDLTKGPVTLTVPAVGKRYVSVHILNMYTDTDAVLSQRTIGESGGTFTIVGPGQTATSKSTVQMTTPHGWMIVRVLVDGEPDMAAAHAVQDKIILTGPKVTASRAYADRDAKAASYFADVADLMASDPPRAADRSFLGWTKSLGAEGLKTLSPEQWAEVEKGVAQARALVTAYAGKASYFQGWSYPKASLGLFGQDYAYRAIVALVGLGALVPEEAMYMNPASPDGTGEFTGDGVYRLSLPKDPPVDAFWSLTMYEIDGQKQKFLTQNPINRYSIGDRTPGIKRNADGSLDLWISRTDPGGERTSNWLPAPASGPYSLSMRAYLPREELRDGRYRLPAVIKVP
ncbi:MAG: hypothetical protein RJA87_843 [Pseudomonadota bacterium]|jgi:hypothetical protein